MLFNFKNKKGRINIKKKFGATNTYFPISTSSQALSMAVGMAVVQEVIAKDLATNAQAQGNYIIEKLKTIKDQFKLNA